MSSSNEPWTPHLGPERVVEGIHYGWLMHDHFARYHFALDYCRGKNILDIATGSGYGANVLRNGGAAAVVSADCNHDALAYGRQRYGTDRMIWAQMDAHNLPLSKNFHCVVCFETIEHIADPDRFLGQVKRILLPGGVFLVSTPQYAGGRFVSPCHEREYTLPEYRELLERHFNRVEIYGQRRELQDRIKLVGNLPKHYADASLRRKGAFSLRIYRALHMINKAPNVFLAWAMGLGERKRRAIEPIDTSLRPSPWLSDHHFIMIGVCRNETA